MDNAAVHIDAADTLRPPPPEMPRARRATPKKTPDRRLAVVAWCPDAKQQAMLLEWLTEQGFEVEARTL
jgi:hypothetical protein